VAKLPELLRSREQIGDITGSFLSFSLSLFLSFSLSLFLSLLPFAGLKNRLFSFASASSNGVVGATPKLGNLADKRFGAMSIAQDHFVAS
jgi:hypothetical protein